MFRFVQSGLYLLGRSHIGRQLHLRFVQALAGLVTGLYSWFYIVCVLLLTVLRIVPIFFFFFFFSPHPARSRRFSVIY